MNKIVLFLCFILLGITSCNVDNATKSLFNGEDTNQWKTTGSVTVENGVMTLNDGASLRLKRGNYTDFDLKVKARTIGNGKGYIAFHTTDPEMGYRVALNNDLESSQWWTKTGSLLSVRNLTKSTVKTNEWFNLDIRVEGNSITVLVNDRPVVEYIEPTSPYRTSEHATKLLSNGKFAIQSTEGTLEIESIEVTTLNATSDLSQQQTLAIDETTDHIIRLHQDNFPVLDYHVHLKQINAEEAAKQARNFGINYVLAPNCGIGFPITNNEQVIQYLDEMEGQPFIQAMQGEGREWSQTFSKEVRVMFDFVFTDAMTFTDTKGRRTRLWIPEEVFIDDQQQYMDLIVQKIVNVMQEPMDVYVNPTFLPVVMNDRYDEFWTEERMDKVISAMVETGKVLEINNSFEIPNKAFILKAKEAGLKFTFGSNNSNGDFGKLEYCIRMKEECKLTAEDMYKPNMEI